MPQNLFVLRPGVSYANDGLLRDNEDVDGSARFDITNGNYQVIFVNDVCRNLTRNDFFKQRHCHSHYFTTSAQPAPGCSLNMALRRKSTIWSWRVWQRGVQRRAPVSCFTQPRKPRKQRSWGDWRSWV